MNPSVVNAPNPRADGNPDIAALVGGRAAIAYQSRLPDDSFDIVLRLREANGVLSDEHRPEGDWTIARDADVTALSDGSFLLSWLAQTNEGGQARTNVMGQHLSETGEVLSPPTSLLSQPLSQGRFIVQLVYADPDGGFAVNAASTFSTVDGRFKSSSFVANTLPAVPGSANFIVIPDEGNGRIDTGSLSLDRFGDDFDVTVLTGGELLATTNAGQANIVNQRLRDPDARYNGDPFYSPLQVSFPELSSEAIAVIEDSRSYEPSSFSVAALDDGGFIVVWTVERQISAQLFDASGEPIGGNYSIATSAQGVPGPVVAEVGGDEFLIVWQDAPNGNLDVVSAVVSREELSEGDFTPLPIPAIQAEGFISGRAREGEALRVSGTVDSAYPVSSVSLQWFRENQGIRTPIEGATGRNLTLTQSEVGSFIIIEATVEDSTGLMFVETLYHRFSMDPFSSLVTVEDIPDPTEGSDILLGGTGNNLIEGKGGDDRIDGGLGRDTLIGGDGADVFLYARGSGADTVADFEIGSDRVEFDFDGIGKVRDLARSTDVAQVADDVVIDFGDGDVLTVLGVQKGDLSASDAIFV